MRRRRKGVIATISVVGLCVALLLDPSASAAKRKTTKKPAAASVSATAPTNTIALSKIKVPLAKKDEFCRVANDMKAKFTDLNSKKKQLGTTVPTSIYQSEVALSKTFQKAAPKELGPDFLVLQSYVGYFIKLSSTQDADAIATITKEMSSEPVLARQFDATVRVETLVRRTCGFKVGI